MIDTGVNPAALRDAWGVANKPKPTRDLDRI